MGYQISWRVKDLPELDAKFKTSWSDSDALNKSIQGAKLDLMITLLRCNSSTIFNQEYKTIEFKYNYYKFLLLEKWKFDLQERIKEDDVWFCGWEYSTDKDKEYLETSFEELIILTFTSKESDPISNSEYFIDKKSKIQEILDEVENNIMELMSHEFVDMYREYQIKDDETD